MGVCVLTGEFLEEGGHVLWFVEARPHLGQHLHVLHHQFLHRHSERHVDTHFKPSELARLQTPELALLKYLKDQEPNAAPRILTSPKLAF